MPPGRTEIVLSIICYSLCSGSLILINKLTLYNLPLPSIIISLQLFFTICFIYALNLFDLLPVDVLKWEFIKPYLIYTVAFSIGVFSNMTSLKNSNVETVIVFRSTAPLVVCVLESIFLGRELPSRRSCLALGMIGLGGFCYAATDKAFQDLGVGAYFWPLVYLCAISFEMVYGKVIVQNVKFVTRSGPVQYTNLLGLFPMIIFAMMDGEFEMLEKHRIDEGGGTYLGLLQSLPLKVVTLLVVGCLVGTLIGYSSWWCRGNISATSFTLVGVINKCMTIIANVFIWDQHAVPLGIASLFLSILGGVLYQQAPMKKTKDADDTIEEDDTSKKLLYNDTDKVNGQDIETNEENFIRLNCNDSEAKERKGVSFKYESEVCQ